MVPLGPGIGIIAGSAEADSFLYSSSGICIARSSNMKIIAYSGLSEPSLSFALCNSFNFCRTCSLFKAL